MAGVLKSFQFPQDFYADDVRDIVGTCISRYGEQEWKVITLTNEIHGHLGIYSTLGAKMGLRAKELLQAEGHVSVVSYAGAIPPVSCFNDGLQVSTGASLGHGLIRISEDPLKRPEAVFTCGEKSIRLALKPEYDAIIRRDIEEGVALYGHSPSYWQYVRSLALKYWRDWDRKEIFTEL
ncbi:MAG: formylmethanofuran dehydrogenase subunit E family protein [Bacteroidales bacterium]|nr:formylmethanofuran dehydrogenase subunit E family protein [Bacteroidales bacterium]